MTNEASVFWMKMPWALDASTSQPSMTYGSKDIPVPFATHSQPKPAPTGVISALLLMTIGGRETYAAEGPDLRPRGSPTAAAAAMSRSAFSFQRDIVVAFCQLRGGHSRCGGSRRSTNP